MHFWTPIDRNDKFSTTRPSLSLLTPPLYHTFKNATPTKWEPVSVGHTCVAYRALFALSSNTWTVLMCKIVTAPVVPVFVNPQIPVNTSINLCARYTKMSTYVIVGFVPSIWSSILIYSTTEWLHKILFRRWKYSGFRAPTVGCLSSPKWAYVSPFLVSNFAWCIDYLRI